jgi:hypothetical protein
MYKCSDILLPVAAGKPSGEKRIKSRGIESASRGIESAPSGLKLCDFPDNTGLKYFKLVVSLLKLIQE